MPLTLLCKEPELPYDRVALSQLLAGETTREELQLRPAEWYADRKIDVRFATADELRLDAGECVLSDGAVVRFDRAVRLHGVRPPSPAARRDRPARA